MVPQEAHICGDTSDTVMRERTIQALRHFRRDHIVGQGRIRERRRFRQSRRIVLPDNGRRRFPVRHWSTSHRGLGTIRAIPNGSFATKAAVAQMFIPFSRAAEERRITAPAERISQEKGTQRRRIVYRSFPDASPPCRAGRTPSAQSIASVHGD